MPPKRALDEDEASTSSDRHQHLRRRVLPSGWPPLTAEEEGVGEKEDTSWCAFVHTTNVLKATLAMGKIRLVN